MKRQLHYTGMLRSTASWSKVARELLHVLPELGWSISATDVPDDRHDPRFPLDGRLRSALSSRPEGATELSFSSPTLWAAMGIESPAAAILVWEATRWPPEWLEIARELLDRVMVPSAFCRDSLLACGFPAERVATVPHGIDPETFRPADRVAAGARERLRFLFVGTPARRKGLDVLLRAWQRAFTSSDRATLVIKTTRYDDATRRLYLDRDWERGVEELRRDGHRVEVTDGVLSDEEMADLFRGADVLCQPFRGEGFGLPLLEAMACGTPVVATAWSGPLDFLRSDAGFLVQDFRPIRAEPLLAGFEGRDFGAAMVEPDLDAVVDALREAYADRERLAELGAGAARAAAAWTWEAAARSLIAALAGPDGG